MRVTGDEEKRLPGHPKTANTKKISQLPKETKIGQDGLIKCMTIISFILAALVQRAASEKTPPTNDCRVK